MNVINIQNLQISFLNYLKIKNSGYIFQNSQLFESFELSDTQIKNTVVCPSAYDEEEFKDLNKFKK